MGSCAAHHLTELVRVLQHGAWLHHVFIEGLPVVVGHHHRRAQGLQKRLFPDVGIGIVDKDTGVDVSVGVDVEIPAATRNASSHILGVILAGWTFT